MQHCFSSCGCRCFYALNHINYLCSLIVCISSTNQFLDLILFLDSCFTNLQLILIRGGQIRFQFSCLGFGLGYNPFRLENSTQLGWKLKTGPNQIELNLVQFGSQIQVGYKYEILFSFLFPFVFPLKKYERKPKYHKVQTSCTSQENKNVKIEVYKFIKMKACLMPLIGTRSSLLHAKGLQMRR